MLSRSKLPYLNSANLGQSSQLLHPVHKPHIYVELLRLLFNYSETQNKASVENEFSCRLSFPFQMPESKVKLGYSGKRWQKIYKGKKPFEWLYSLFQNSEKNDGKQTKPENDRIFCNYPINIHEYEQAMWTKSNYLFISHVALQSKRTPTLSARLADQNSRNFFTHLLQSLFYSFYPFHHVFLNIAQSLNWIEKPLPYVLICDLPRILRRARR